jgi:3-hydroxyacyl-CoA dehydrogenase
MKYSKTADLLCELGRFGQKTGAGWYDYVPASATPSQQAGRGDDRRAPQELGITPRKISDEEIVQRLVFALVNEGAHPGRRHCQQGQRHRHGVPDRLRLSAVARRPDALRQPGRPVQRVQAMKRFARTRDDAKFWQPAALLAKLAAEGKTFG